MQKSVDLSGLNILRGVFRPCKEQVQEKFRICWNQLEALPNTQRALNEYVRQLIVSKQLDFNKFHFRGNSQRYEGQISKNGKYVELTAQEQQIVQNGDFFGMYISSAEMSENVNVVEVGWNKEKQICKLGLEIDFLPKDGGRTCFLCFGTANNGIKTYNFHSKKKRKTYYFSTEDITYLDVSQAISMFSLN